MKILPRTRLIVVTAIGLASGAAILVLAQTPTPTPKPKDLPFHLSITCSHQKIDSYRDALQYWKTRPNYRRDDYKIRYDPGHPTEGSYPENLAPPCPDKANSNATQHLATNDPDNLVKFLQKLNQ